MEVLTAIVGSLAGKVADYMVAPIARQVGYLFNYKSKRVELNAQLDKLKVAKENVQRGVDEAKRNGDDILDPVESWLTQVNGKISAEAARQLVEDEEKAKKRCLFGLCPDFKSRYKFSKKAVKEANSITELLGNGLFERVSCRPTPEGMPPVKDYEEFESRRGAVVGVMDALKDANLSIIGVYGMGGVGKTTLVKQVAKQALDEKLFGYVVMAAVTQKPNMEYLQKEIVEKLDMKLEEETFGVRAGRLRKRLEEEKSSVLIIFDDIWEKMDLDALGVPSGDQHMGCKILMTSRRLDLLKSMDSQKNLAIDILTEEEAWKMFQNMAGDIVGRGEIQPTAGKIAKKCGGLPIAIVTLAKALKHKEDLFHWKNALEKLNKPSKDDDVYRAIKLSYTFLAEEVQKTFLLCSLMSHNAVIEDLLIYCRGYGLFRDLDTIQKVRDRVLTFVSDLKDSSLLLSSPTPGCFDMHDVVRDVAVSIASMDHRWLSLEKIEVSEELSNEERMKDCNLISFQDAQVSGLPDELECPNLSFLSMGMSGVNRFVSYFYGERSSLEIPINFLKGMKKLKALSFAEVQFSSLPFSTDFHLLKTLRTLYLFGCELDDISIIGKLINLEILNLRKSRFEMLPREMVQLRKLKLLDLSGCRDLTVIPPNVLSGLSRLEELYLYDSFKSWEVVDEGRESPAAGSNASLVELENLSLLGTLEVHVGNVKAMPKDTTFFGKLERYKISVGPNEWYPWEYKLEISRMLKLLDGGDKMLDDGLLRKVQNLSLDGVKDVMNLERISYRELSVGSFSQLRVLRVSRCESLENLFSFSIAREFHQLEEIEMSDCQNITELIAKTKEEETLKFDKLNYLKLSNLPKLVRLCGVENNLGSFKQGRGQSIDLGSNAPGLFDHKVAFPSIEKLEVTRCHKLKYLFPSSIVKSFVQLKTLDVSNCDELEQVIILSDGLVEEGRNNIMVFPALDCLTLRQLPNLQRFCFGNQIEFQSLRELEIRNCPVLSTFSEVQKSNVSMENCHAHVPQYLFNEKVALPTLEVLQINGMENLERLWPNQLADEESFSRLTELRLKKCHKLLNVFPLSMSRRLQRLERLEIIDCKLVEEIFEEGFPSGVVQAQENIIRFEFPDLTKLELVDLPNLKSFYHQIHTIKLPSLKKELTVSGCDKVGILFGSSQQEIPINELPLFCLNELYLEELSMGWKDAMKEICHSQQIASRYFCKLKVVKLLSFPKEMEVFPSNLFKFLTSLPNLHHLEIRCAYFKEILEEVQNELFQNLRKLEVRWCPNLKDNLVSSSLSFKNLVTLQVEACHGIIKLVTHSVAKSLQQLQEMRISNCLEIEEMIEGSGDDDEGGEVKDEIDFPQLKLLQLKTLRKLESFCSSRNYTFQFPFLQTVIVEECPSMKMFSQGDSYTPMLNKVKLSAKTWRDEERWLGNLNSIIQEMFKEKSKEDEDNPSTLEQLTLEWDDEMKEIWHEYGPLQQLPSQYFCTLKVVTINAFPEEMEMSSYHQLFQFLISLPNLHRLVIEDVDFKEIFQSEVKLSSALEDRVQELRLESSISIEKPWHDGVPQIPTSTLEVQSCRKLKYLFPSSMVKSFVQLKTLVVEDCDNMEQLIILSEGLVDEERNNIMVFPQLDCLKLHQLPNLKRFCSGNQIEFPSLRKLEIWNCPVLSIFSEVRKNNISMENYHADVPQYLFNEKLSFPNLEQLTLTWNDEMKEIRHAYSPPQQLPSQYFPKLKVVTLQLFAKEMDIFSSQLFQFLISLPNVQRLHVKGTHSLMFPSFAWEDIFEWEDEQVTFSAIKELALESISVEKLWHDDGVPQITCFRLLTVLEVTRCCKLKYLFPSSMVKSFVQLKTLVVKDCDNMEQLITLSEGLVDKERNNIMVFPQLDCLKLQGLPNLRRFCSGNQIEFPSLRKLAIVMIYPSMTISRFCTVRENISMENCQADISRYLFNEGLSFPILEQLTLTWNDGMNEIWHAYDPPQQLPSQCFPRLKVVTLQLFAKEMDIFSSQLLQLLISLPKLQRLHIHTDKFEPIFQSEDKPSSALEEVQVTFPAIKELALGSISVEKLWHDDGVPQIASFGLLTKLEVWRCPKLKYLFPSSMIKSFVQLKTLDVSCCDEMEQLIILSEGLVDEDKNNIMVFPQLDCLDLRRLPNLKRFCCGNRIEFPSLRKLAIVMNYPSMRPFSTVREKISMETFQADVSRYLFNEGLSFPILEQLTLTWNDGMNEIWHAYDPPQQLLSQCFPRLKVVTLQLFAKEMDIFSSQLLQLLISLPKLQRLRIHKEDYFKPIFQSEDKPSSALEEVQVTFPAIKELVLGSISVEKLWHDDGVPQIASFGLLTKLEVWRCPKLKYLFPSSMVKSFVQLKTLDVSDCDEMEQLIILSEGLVDEERNNIVVFPQLDCLTLHKLPNLKRFCFENRIEFPSLRKLEILDCPVLSTSSEVGKNNISMENCHTDVPQYLLNKGLSLPNLEELDLGWNDGVKEICHAHGPAQQLASQYFCSLKVVGLRSFPEEMEIFPSQLFQFLISLPHLQGLEIQNANVKEIFKSPSSALEEVQEALFQNLVTLEIERCHGIKKLVTYSTSKCLVQLQEMRISWCNEIEEIIEGSTDDDEDGEVKDEIHFPQLKLLELWELPKLESFCSSGNYTFQFPSLETVIVYDCPKMKMFSKGDPETPMLQNVKLSYQEDEDDERHWSGSLNRTIEEMFQEKVRD